MASHEVAKIDADAACVTLINVYEVEPEKQADLVRLLSEATETVFRRQPGFVSVSVHSAMDGKRIVNYAQWASKEHFEDFMKKPETQQKLKQFAALVKTVSPGLYKVNAVHAE
ncbi:antibiotic biosynthesis monooxygenase [Methylocystis sp. SC2]|uniref:antibiotic biosynthesis monooxygenase family protein n=1 Tax=Methylocystis sp. (strain SC2) TaxID=187303 RepID=UPI00027AF303|nr:antibiotic biosynthesis monooxygenase family protein [Methylocystis sp. SC2]CCJ07811.1 Antibiotic biosynthesis monooxygenase [Methylocystis sp. SC2]